MAEIGLARDIEAIRATLAMDGARRELYVEGTRDQRFLMWLVDEIRNPEAIVQTIDAVEMPGVESGGNRARLVAFAEEFNDERVRLLIDADHDRLLGNQAPTGCWLTDLRDLDGYVGTLECVTKAFCLGLGRTREEAESAFEQAVAAARKVGILRVLSDVENYRMPFAGANLIRRCTIRSGALSFNFEALIIALADASVGRSRLDEVRRAFASMADRLKEIPNDQVVHGKDLFRILSCLMAQHGADRDTVPAVMWSTFERAMSTRYANLSEVVEYLTAA